MVMLAITLRKRAGGYRVEEGLGSSGLRCRIPLWRGNSIAAAINAVHSLRTPIRPASSKGQGLFPRRSADYLIDEP